MFEQSQSVYTSLAHRCWNFSLSEEQNRAAYGDQASSQGLGGNWRLEVGVRSASNPQDVDLSDALNFVKTKIDHRCLWLDWVDYASRPTPVEVVSQQLAMDLFQREPPLGYEWSSLRVFENDQVDCLVRPEQETLDLTVRISNLRLTFRGKPDLVTGLILPRSPIMQEVRKLLDDPNVMNGDSCQDWLEGLATALSERFPKLIEMRVDVTPGESFSITLPLENSRISPI